MGITQFDVKCKMYLFCIIIWGLFFKIVQPVLPTGLSYRRKNKMSEDEKPRSVAYRWMTYLTTDFDCSYCIRLNKMETEICRTSGILWARHFTTPTLPETTKSPGWTMRLRYKVCFADFENYSRFLVQHFPWCPCVYTEFHCDLRKKNKFDDKKYINITNKNNNNNSKK